jgi:hypothetical protein
MEQTLLCPAREESSLLPAATTIVCYWAQPHLPHDPAGEVS